MSEELNYYKALDRFRKALETRALDPTIVNHFNDVHDEAETTEKYIAELEWQNYHSVQRLRKTMEFLAECRRLRAGIVRNIKQLRKARGYKSIVIKSR